ncbi:hypothetical protein [Rhizobium lusitanum]|uniref:Uncharacterized protein n=1 Tax=Rhizobium lusitanum TaxID=293958 RepID=A0A7X0MH95_9HYPH|nr:hypothetical protein [Rhizobium lusitanum]MBB6488873.1 hypothetical protein [Rhizobium lusitanum]
MINGLLSNIGIDVAQKCGLDTDAFLKNAAILHENIFFHKGIYGKLIGFDYSNASMAASWTNVGRENEGKLAQNRGFSSIFPDVREIWPTFERFNPFRNLQNEVRLNEKYGLSTRQMANEIVARTFGLTIEEVQAGKAGNTWENIPLIVAQDAACLREFKRYAPSAMGVFTEAHSVLLDKEAEAQVTPLEHTPLAVLLGQDENESVFPDFGAFSWDEIIELRRDPNVAAYRIKMGSLFATGNEWRQRQMNLSTLYMEELEQFSQRAKPRPRVSSFIALLGQIPTAGFPNPISIVGELWNLKEESDLARDFNWLYFVQRARRKREAN